MSVEIPDWKGTLLALYIDGQNIPMRDGSMTIRAPKERQFTVQTKNGAFFHHLPHEFSFTFTTYAISTAGVNVGPFLFSKIEADPEDMNLNLVRREGDRWTFQEVSFGRGTISNISQTGIDSRSVPVLAVDAEFLEFNYNPVS
jgi:hypothetical protein